MKLIMTKGLPASGKSTWAKQQKGFKRVNKDDLRLMMDNGQWSRSNEKFVLLTRDTLVASWLVAGSNVIVDDTNFAPEHESRLREIANRYSAEFEIKDFTDVPIEICIERDLKRSVSVGEKVIREMYEKYVKKPVVTVARNPKLLDCYIFDIDGTLAHMVNRGPFEWHRVGEDAVDIHVAHILNIIANFGVNVFLFSGRDSVCRDETILWLDNNGINYDHLIMRPEKNTEKDAIIKERMYREHIEGKYNVRAVFDDRNQVVEMWRSLGLPCYQVAEGNF